ncbi:MAG: hypothetical protein AAFY83_03980 [Pseudomonadota bacterium]
MNPVLLGAVGIVTVLLGLATWKAPRLTSIIIWALVATVFFTSALLIKLPGKFSENALWLTLGVPLIWVIFQFFTYWEKRNWLVVASLLGISIISAAIVFTSEPMV